MKKLISLALALTLALTLAACGGEAPADTTGPAASTPTTDVPATVPTEPGYTFQVGSTEIAMHAPAAPILEALGEAKSYTEEASCAFDGLDKTYFYGSFYLTTYPNGSEENIFSLWLVDDSLSTPEGIYIGAPQAQVEAAYGAEGYNGTNAYIMTKGVCKLTIIMDGGSVSSIQYDAVVE